MIRVRQVKVKVLEDNKDILLKNIARKLGMKMSDIISYKIIKKSIDARDKRDIYYVYEVDIDTYLEDKILLKNKSNDIMISPLEEYVLPKSGNLPLNRRIVVVGSGPAGLFCSYILAEAGYRPLIIERGEKIEDRVKSVEHFFLTNELNVNSNIQFGEGGAGTFSDGKLNTLVKDKAFRGKKVFEIFVENGAPEEIMYMNKPHIGTDILRRVIVSMREKIKSLGGEFLYNSTVTDILFETNRITGIKILEKDVILCDALVLAIGHSARNTFKMLHDKGVMMRPKNFAVGLRMEHPQEMINKSQYGEFSKYLEPASYKLTYQSKSGRGVYSFCMCPGGFVVNASSEEGLLAVNGMSNYKRDEVNANSAIVMTVSAKDFGEELFSGMDFQRKLEKKAYELGKEFIPIQLFKDFKNNCISTSLGDVTCNTKGNTCFANLRELFSDDMNSSFIEAIEDFGHKIKGFDRDDAVLLGVETRTSSPIMIVRDEAGEASIKGLYPCGEGAGYAGGITTAAMDGIKIAEEIIKKYHT